MGGWVGGGIPWMNCKLISGFSKDMASIFPTIDQTDLEKFLARFFSIFRALGCRLFKKWVSRNMFVPVLT